MYCVQCGVQNVDDANFCSNCGKELSHSPTEEVVESRTDESQSEVRVHHPWMPVQQQPQEQVRVHHPWMSAQEQPQEQVHNEPPEESQEQAQEQVHNEPPEESQEQAQGEVPNVLKSILRRVKGWSKKKKILAGLILFFLFITCVGVIFGEPVEEDGTTVSKSLEPPKELVENIGGEGAIHEGHWHDADKKCRENDTDHPEFSEDRFNEVIDAATASSENLGLSMPSGAKLTELQSVFDGTVSSSDVWVDAFWANQELVSTLYKGIDDITLKKFGSYRTRDGTLIWVEWRDNDDGSPEWATARSYWDKVRVLRHWFDCGTAKIN